MMVNILTELAALRKSREHKTLARIKRENKTPARMDCGWMGGGYLKIL